MRLRCFAVLFLAVVASAGAQDWSWASKDSEGFLKVNPSRLKGSIATGGSSTVYPIAQFVAEQLRSEGFSGQLSVDNIGSGAGLKRFVAGELDVANSSRPIVPAERKGAESRGKGKVLEFKIALDALVLLVNEQNAWVKDLDENQVQEAFATAETWSDLDPSWPVQKIHRYIPETSHGTFDFFQEHFWDDKGTLLKGATDVQRFQDFNQLMAAVERDKYGIGFVGYAYFKESEGTKALAYRGVRAARATVDDRSYELARYLYVYVLQGTLTSKPQVAGYLAFLLNATSRAAARVGYFPLTAPELNAQKKALADALAGKF